MASSKSDRVIEAFNGAIKFRILDNPERAYLVEVSFSSTHPLAPTLFNPSAKPPAHFHPYQTEYIRVITGTAIVEVEGQEYVLSPTDGEFQVRAGAHHRLYPPQCATTIPEEQRRPAPEIRLTTSGQKVPQAFHEDVLFLENWYKYLNHIAATGGQMDMIQLLSMFDAAGSYLSLPAWLPFGRIISRTAGIVVGRWIGAAMGYQPYYRKWTTDWQRACEKMETSFLQRRFADKRDTE